MSERPPQPPAEPPPPSGSPPPPPDRPDAPRSEAGGPPGGEYPVSFWVDYPDRDLNRLTTALRIFTALPIAILAALLPSLVFPPVLLTLLFRRKYPRWWFDWNRELQRFTNRVTAYLALLDDRYPATDDHQSVHLEFAYPDAERGLARWMPLVKWLLALPHYLVLVVLGLGAILTVVAAWFAIVFTGRYPRWAFDYVVGVLRWSNRVMGYAFLLVTDRYPPFRLRD